MKTIYLDHAATTPTDPQVVDAMLPYFTERFGNPSTLYSLGREAKRAVEEARERIASTIGAKPEEIVFTSGGTESDNFALQGVAFALQKKGDHIITSSIEHHAISETCKFLEKRGFAVTYLPVDGYGRVDPSQVSEAITPQTILISVMHANNEIGTVQPIGEMARVARENGICFHTDAVQTVGSLPIDVDELGVDLLSMSAHKFYGPKGVGALYVRSGTKIVRFLHGGDQERKRRASTENVPGIVGMGKAIELAKDHLEKNRENAASLRDRLIDGLSRTLENIRLNGHPVERLPNNVSVCIEKVEGESMLLNLDAKGICASSGSACTSGSLHASGVLLAIGVPAEVAHGSLRFTVGRSTSEEDIDYVLEVLPEIVGRLRAMSALA
jgi:cysteine desulfurase